jgi:hypothetical protein
MVCCLLQILIKCTITFLASNSPQHALNVGYSGKCIDRSVNMKFLGLQIDNCLNWTNRVDEFIPKLTGACYAVRSVCHVINTDTLESVYVACFYCTMKYGIIC